MHELFGIPVGALAVVLAGLLLVALAVVAGLALRNRVFLRLGVRNLGRRRARSALIVAGLMLGTAIVAAALATGDTMSRTIRSTATAALGQTDEVVAAKGVSAALETASPGTGQRYFPRSTADRIERAAAGSGLLDGVAPVIVEPLAVQDATSRQSEPRLTLFAGEARTLRPFGPIRSDGRTLSLADLRPGEVYLDESAADDLHAAPGHTLRLLVGGSSATARVRAVVRYAGAATDGGAVLMPLAAAQRLLGTPGLVDAVFVSNRGGVAQTDRVIALLRPTVSPLGLETDGTRQDALEAADEAGSAFMSLFTTFGSFSIAAGLLLIFLIFVMLAAERRGELGIARAVGTRRGHLVQMFLFEGVAYDLAAAAAGALLGIAVAYGMVLVMAGAFSAVSDIEIAYAVEPASIVVAYAVGVLLTLAVVAFSAWRVSRMNIVSAIRSLPDPRRARTRRRWLPGLLVAALGGLLAVQGAAAENAVVLGIGVSLAVLGLVPLLELAGAPARAVRTGAGLALVAWFVLPVARWLLGDLKLDFSIFVFGGLMVVVGATWTIVYNADVLLGAVGATLGRIPRLAPVLRMAMAYPLRSLFRTGVTLAMFMLVVFTLVVGATTSGSFMHAIDDVGLFGGGFDVRATASPAAPVPDMRAALARARGVRASDFRVVSGISTLPVQARQTGTGADEVSYLLHGADDAFLEHTTYGLAARARGYASAAAVWRAVRARPGLAVVDQYAVPRRQNWGTPPANLRLKGFYLEDERFDPVRVAVRDPQTGKRLTLTVIGVLPDSAPALMSGIWTSQRTLAPVFGARVRPTTFLFALRSGVNAETTATRLESAFLANGLEADSLGRLLADSVGASRTFNRLVMGFMGLGLIVGVAALGVISSRAVVERRQQIGVLRAIGFRRRMVLASFLLESSFVALTSIVVGTALGLAVAWGVIVEERRTPSWSGMAVTVPWQTLILVFLLVYVVALLTTLAPALRASRIFPAQALRYE